MSKVTPKKGKRISRRKERHGRSRPSDVDAHHGHGHSHDHSHHLGEHRHRDHGGPHRSGAAVDMDVRRAPFERHAGEGKILFLDAFSGISGDMTVSALLDLGVPFEIVERAVESLSLDGVAVRIEAVDMGSIGALRFHVDVDGPQRHRSYHDIDTLIGQSALDPAAKGLARSIFEKLGAAEADVHRIPIDEVHFHEVGASDAIVDIVAAAACFSFIGAEVVCAPLPMGRGFVDAEHGRLPLPAPATVACLRGAPTYDAGIEAELVTPTGAAIVARVARSFARWPTFAPERVGFGAGTKKLADRPNVLRAVLGDSARSDARDGEDTHVVVEANVDDMTGELAGHAIAALMRAGALDAWVTPVTMKKGRPGFVLSALARQADGSRLSEVVLRETSSIGVRWARVSRVERPRSVRTVQTPYGDLPVKVSSGPFGAPVVKPEFDACREAAERHGVSVRTVVDAARGAAAASEVVGRNR